MNKFSVEKIEKLNRKCLFVLNLVYVSLLWGALTLLGGVLFGIGPATYAVVAYFRKDLRQGSEEKIPVASTVWFYFKENYKEALLISWLYLISGIVLVVDFFYLTSWHFRIFFFLLMVLYTFSLSYIFPIMAHYEWKGIFFKIKMSILIAIGHIQNTLLFLGVSIGIYYLMSKFVPTFVFVFGIGLLLLFNTWNGLNVFKQMAEKHEKYLREQEEKTGVQSPSRTIKFSE